MQCLIAVDSRDKRESLLVEISGEFLMPWLIEIFLQTMARLMSLIIYIQIWVGATEGCFDEALLRFPITFQAYENKRGKFIMLSHFMSNSEKSELGQIEQRMIV